MTLIHQGITLVVVLLTVEGVDWYYDRAGEPGLLYVPFGEEGSPLDERVGRHIRTLSMLLEVFSTWNSDRAIAVENLPALDEGMQNGPGAFLAPPGGGAASFKSLTVVMHDS